MAQAAFQWWTGSTKLRGSHQPVDRRVAVAMGFEPVRPRDPKGQDVDALHGVENITKAITPSIGGAIGGEKSPCETYIEYILSWYVPQLSAKTFRVEEPHEKEKIWGSSFPRPRTRLSIADFGMRGSAYEVGKQLAAPRSKTLGRGAAGFLSLL